MLRHQIHTVYNSSKNLSIWHRFAEPVKPVRGLALKCYARSAFTAKGRTNPRAEDTGLRDVTFVYICDLVKVGSGNVNGVESREMTKTIRHHPRWKASLASWQRNPTWISDGAASLTLSPCYDCDVLRLWFDTISHPENCRPAACLKHGQIVTRMSRKTLCAKNKVLM